ncbi:MAG: T9SS type A sorting domain-containing protein [Bacteroidetes bacterium]|nr:T9SS type A sorting domain-containing protein [Bacteroidota bacterium]
MKKNLFLLFSFIILCFSGNAQWILKNSNSPKRWVNNPGIVNNKAYLLNVGDSIKVWEYDPVSNIYTQKAYSGLTAGWQDLSFTINNQVYLIQVMNFATRMYDVASNTWVAKDQTSNNLFSIFMGLFPPANYGMEYNGSLFAFSINNKGYFGGVTLLEMPAATEIIAPFLFEYNPITDTYYPINIGNLGGMASIYNMLGATTFEIAGKIYIVGSARNPTLMNPGNGVEIIEFNPSNNSMTAKTSCNCGQLNGSASFVLNGLGYVNANNDCPGITSREPIYTYNPLTDSWTYQANLPTTDTAYINTGFIINGKGYIGVGTNLINGCTTTTFNPKLYEFIPETVSINENSMDEFSVFPNPTSKSINIIFPENGLKNRIEIFNAVGVLQFSKNIDFNQNEIVVDLEALPAGMYFIRWSNSIETKNIRTVKN